MSRKVSNNATMCIVFPNLCTDKALQSDDSVVNFRDNWNRALFSVGNIFNNGKKFKTY